MEVSAALNGALIINETDFHGKKMGLILRTMLPCLDIQILEVGKVSHVYTHATLLCGQLVQSSMKS